MLVFYWSFEYSTFACRGEESQGTPAPAWFEARNMDFRYQLTVIGQFAQGMVAAKMNNGSFTVKTNKPGVEVSWR